MGDIADELADATLTPDDVGEETKLTCVLCRKKFMGAVLCFEQQVCENCDPEDVHDLTGYMGDAL